MPKDAQPQDPLDRARAWLSALVEDGAAVTLSAGDAEALRGLVDETSSARSAQANVARWLRARAEIALNRPDDPEQNDHGELAQGWRQGSHNSLHAAANAVDRGEAARPPSEWPAFMRGQTPR
jgi:hypothetical protein